MISWFSKNKYPDYWISYRDQFKNQKKKDLNQIRFVVFDTETTGLDVRNDRILSIGAISLTGNIMDVADSLDLYVKQDKFNRETVEIHGLLKEGNILKIDEEEAVIRFLEYIKNAVLIAHHASFDIGMINYAIKRLH
jgi:DNA polymerase-3 subunit epsilon